MVNSLEQYWNKRDFKKTREPTGKQQRTARKSKSEGGLFVVHKHDARRLHYDLRLEHNGVLWSWAVTRGPSLDPSEKRLAVHVEDHPLDYADFEGTIPEGSYGAGSVIIWDRGTWLPEGDAAADMKKGHLSFELVGKKLKGSWHLVRLKAREKEKRDNWLLIKAKDEFATADGDILESAPESIKSGLTNEEIAEGKKPKTIKTAKTAKTAKTVKSSTQPASAKKKSAAMPDFIPPALATLKETPPAGAGWLHEVKFDGYRIQAHISAGKVKLFTRSGLDWTTRFGEPLRLELSGLKCQQAIIDGEIIVLSDKGVASFALLQGDLSAGRVDRMHFYAFDLLHLDNTTLLEDPLIERKSQLEELLKQTGTKVIRYSEHFEESGETMLAHACRMGLEGVVSKKIDAPYQSGRMLDWIKSKCTLRQEFIVIGYLASAATGRGLRSIIVGYRKNGKLVYAGRVGTGFSTKAGDDLKRKLEKLKVKSPVVAGLEKKEKNAIWVRPELVAEVEFRTWTSDGILRQASFQGLREDKPPQEVVKEQPVAPSISAKPAAGKARTKTDVQLSNADKLLWPKAKISKKDLLDYYGSVWPRMEQFVVNRPLSLLRAPDGIGGQRFFQKHASPGMHEAISTLRDPKDKQEHLYIRDFNGLAALVQLGVVEIHIWGAMVDAIETPDQITFDLDPDEGVTAETVRAAALEVKTRLEDLGFPTFVKTSGGKGFHVIVPLKPKARWDEVKDFAHDFADAMTQVAPDKYTATMSKKARKGRIFIDYLRNGRGSTTVAPYSTRAKDDATVSMPIEWKSLAGGVSPTAFTIGGKETSKMLDQPDPWKDFFKAGKPLQR
jgi:bifunctional non-homologous end joining protein LigD